MTTHSDIEHLESYLGLVDQRLLAEDVDIARVGAYRGYAEIMAHLVELGRTEARRRPQGGARLRITGASVDRSPLVAMVIGPDMAPLTSVLMAGIHPIEWIGVETLLALIERLVADPPGDRRILAFPLINVDGFRQVEAWLRQGVRRWLRTNRNGVDLNRNWPTHFRPRKLLPRSWMAGWNHGGHEPLSEPEIAAVVAQLDREHAHSRIDVALSLHSFGRMILWPYGGRWRPPRALMEHRRAALGIKERLWAAQKGRYGRRQASHWVPGMFIRGMEIDHLHERYGATALLVECTSGGLRLGDPSSWIHPFRWYNPPDPAAEAAALARALEPFVRGQS